MSSPTQAVKTHRVHGKKTGKNEEETPTVAERNIHKSGKNKHDKPTMVTADDVSPSSQRQAKEEEKKNNKVKREKRSREEGDAEVLHGSFVVADLPTSMASIYTRTVRHLLPPHHQKCISEAEIMEETDGATLTFEVTNKEVAAAMFKRLQNMKLYGRRWKVQYHPLRAVQCAKEACLVDAQLVPAAPRALALRALSSVHGFLTLADDAMGETMTAGTPLEEMDNHTDKHSDDLNDEHNGFHASGHAGISDVDVVDRVVASFVDEGSALHARALLSGRMIGNSGVRMFLERHR
ncbi:uncharacterized protein TM35_000021660 [Trypanosoma theileri]|uniref:Uncharacterized protein n=1 Tax=Trypanosoma theileri TaxID=67003 RepID=A0A1X0P8R4_9TRYP|nr:uncharacterized protein TM35_000021660 [Trypanosoma theileri]ORC92840.1 hypothetical protein TM35_000021660 [Trypanosoma theileri]